MLTLNKRKLDMKNILKYFSLCLLIAAMSACEKEEIGGTAVQEMAGEWYVMVDGVDADGNVVFENPFGMSYVTLYTFNTNDNNPNQMYIDDEGSIWAFKVIANVDYNAMTFSATGAIDEYYGISVDILNGKIVKDGAKSQAGYTADSISFMVKFEDDPYIDEGYWDYLWIHGYRRTGLNGGYD